MNPGELQMPNIDGVTYQQNAGQAQKYSGAPASTNKMAQKTQ